MIERETTITTNEARRRHRVRRSWLAALALGACVALDACAAMPGGAPAQSASTAGGDATQLPNDDEFIRVAADHWSFEGATTGRRFVPWGANLVLTSKDDLNVFGPRYSNERYETILAACEQLHINVLKVFLPICYWLPDPQTPGQATIAPGYMKNLDDFLVLCRRYHIRAVISFTCWGGNGCKWWHEGGEYWGRRPWKSDEGVDSIEIVNDFWKQLVTHLRDNPTVFSYTPSVEWTLPAGNLTWNPPTVKWGNSVVTTEQGQWYWRRWVQSKYGVIEALNKAWGASQKSFDEVTPANYDYDSAQHKYADPDAKVLDYQNFRDWTTLYYMTPQFRAIRAARPRQMVTLSNHMRFWDLWEGGAFAFMGVTPFEHKHLVDYMTLHTNFSEADDGADKRSDEEVANIVAVLARFVGAGKPMPIILEEYTFTSARPERVAQMQSAMVRATRGHISGWTTWYLQYPEDPAEGADVVRGGPEVQSYWLTRDLQPSPWGLAARDLYDELLKSDLSRRPAKTIVPLNRRTELVPKGLGVVLKHMQQFDPAIWPIDYQIEHEPDMDIRLVDGRKKD